MTFDADLVVVGGGPAGLASAIEGALAGWSVVIAEPRRGVIDKACGEGLTPSAVRALERLGVQPNGFPFLGVRYADCSDVTAFGEGRFSDGDGLGVRRSELHARLLDRAISLGVTFEHRRIRTVRQSSDGVVADKLARWLVAADGLHSPIRRQLGLGRPPRRPRRMGAVRHFEVSPWSSHVTVYWAPDAEAYVTPVSATSVGVAMLFSGAARSWESLMASFPVLQDRIAGAAAGAVRRGGGPFEQRVARRSAGRILLVGDAAGFMDPITGEGVHLGLRAARAAVTALVAGDPAGYERAWRRATRRSFLLTGALLSLTGRAWLRRRLIRIVRSAPWLITAALRMQNVDEGTPVSGVGAT